MNVDPRDLPLAQVLCADGELQERDRAVGRWQRRVRWVVNGDHIAVDWHQVRSAFSADLPPSGSPDCA